jgi:hypothetical protein
MLGGRFGQLGRLLLGRLFGESAGDQPDALTFQDVGLASAGFTDAALTTAGFTDVTLTTASPTDVEMD